MPVAAETVELLTEVIARLGDQGRLRMSVERATAYFRSCGAGFILMQIGTPPGQRDPELSSIIFDDMMAAISTEPSTHRASATPTARPRGGSARSVAGQEETCR